MKRGRAGVCFEGAFRPEGSKLTLENTAVDSNGVGRLLDES